MKRLESNYYNREIKVKVINKKLYKIEEVVMITNWIHKNRLKTVKWKKMGIEPMKLL